MFDIKWNLGDNVLKLSSNHKICSETPFIGVYIEVDEKVIAYGVIKEISIDPFNGQKVSGLINIDIISVDVTYQKQGIGTKIIKTLLDFCLPTDIIYIYMITEEGKGLCNKIEDERIYYNLNKALTMARRKRGD